MAEVTIEKISIESHVPTDELLRSAISGRDLEITYTAERGNGSIVELNLTPTLREGDVRDLLFSEEMVKRLESLDIQINDMRE